MQGVISETQALRKLELPPRAELEEKSPSRSGPVRDANDFRKFDPDVLFLHRWLDSKVKTVKNLGKVSKIAKLFSK